MSATAHPVEVPPGHGFNQEQVQLPAQGAQAVSDSGGIRPSRPAEVKFAVTPCDVTGPAKRQLAPRGWK